MLSARTAIRTLALAAAAASPLAATVMAVSFAVPAGAMAPEPDPVPRRWQLEIEPGPLRVISLDVDGVGPRVYAYMPYRVVNNSGEDLLFAPLFELALGNGQVIRSGRDVPQQVTQRLVESTQNPFTQDQIAIIGDLRQGEENSKHGMVVWALPDLDPAKITVYAAGFSGETETVKNPAGDQDFVLRKTLMLEFDSPGNLRTQKSEAIPLRNRTWIMR